jgi:beta-N-acetylhexosaminidase
MPKSIAPADFADCGRCFLLGFEGPTLSADEKRTLARLAPGGVILFRRNLSSPEALAELFRELRELLPGPRLFAIDQEGGRVSRLAPWLGPTPSATTLAGAGVDTVRRFGASTGQVLRSLGFNVDLAPVVDLSAADAPNGIADRSFGTDPGWVSIHAGAFLDGLQERGVAGCLKHFPGQGEATVDAHESRPRVPRSAAELECFELEPFRALAPKAALVMVGHAYYPALDPDVDRPACLAPAVVDGWLRGRLDYRGLIATDDLEMGAVTDFAPDSRDAVLALTAGCELLLYCRDLARASVAFETLARAAADDTSLRERVRSAAAKVAATAARWPAQVPDLDAWSRARAAIAEVSALA